MRLPVAEIERLQYAFRAKSVNSFAGDGRRSARSFVETEVVTIIGGVVNGPDGLTGESVERVDDSAVFAAMEQDDPAARHHRAAETLANVDLPQSWRT